MMAMRPILENAKTSEINKIKDFLLEKNKEALTSYKASISVLISDDSLFEKFLECISFQEMEELIFNRNYFVNEYIIFSRYFMSKIIYDKKKDKFKFRTEDGRNVASNPDKRKKIMEKLVSFYFEERYHSFFSDLEFKKFIFEFKSIRNPQKFLIALEKVLQPYLDLQELLYKCLDYENNRKEFRMKLINCWNINFCPYCNSNEIMKYDNSKKSTGELDHLLPKSIFPLFSLSYGNFIVSCSVCNQKFKNDKVSEYVFDRNFGFGNEVTFNYKNLSVDSYLNEEENDIQLYFDVNPGEKQLEYNSFIDEFRLKDIYSNLGPRTDVCDIFRAIKNIYSDGNEKELKKIVRDDVDINQEIRDFIENQELNTNQMKLISRLPLLPLEERWKYINHRHGKCKSEILDIVLNLKS